MRFSLERSQLALHLGGSARRSDILEGAWSGVAALQHLIRMPPGRFSSEAVGALSAKLRPRGRPRTRLRDYISPSAPWGLGSLSNDGEEETRSTFCAASCHWSLTLDEENGWTQPSAIFYCIHQGKTNILFFFLHRLFLRVRGKRTKARKRRREMTVDLQSLVIICLSPPQIE